LSRPVGEGLAEFLGEQLGEPVAIENVSEASAGARRRNVLFDAVTARARLELVASITPSAAILLTPTETEAASLRLAEEAKVPVPHVHFVCTESRYVGGPFFVSTRVAGETVPRKVLRLVERERIGDRLVAQLGEAFARLHAVPVARAPTGLALSGGANAVERALAAMGTQLDSLWQPAPALALGLRWLEREAAVVPPRLAFTHGDLRNGNIIVDASGLRAVLDWEGAHLGDPMEDLAWICLRTWRFGSDALEVGGFAKRPVLVEAYTRAGGEFHLRAFHWWKVLGTLRWGIGLARQAIGHMDGSVPSIVMAASGRRVAELEFDLLTLLRTLGTRSPS
jgi:aminoglycoside phosphotransferase (APT) family kinase protein